MHKKGGGRVSRPPTNISDGENLFKNGIRRTRNVSKLSDAVGYTPSQAPRRARGP